MLEDDAGRFHSPDRGWDCAACTEPWPCAAERRRLTGELGATPAAIEQLMLAWLSDALGKRPDLSYRELRERHLGWIRVRDRA
ncbi:MAG: hypothetical protein HOV79_13720 [Hamadaea sp.]|nr:hypothetical protein [Hamadaea sp.]